MFYFCSFEEFFLLFFQSILLKTSFIVVNVLIWDQKTLKIKKKKNIKKLIKIGYISIYIRYFDIYINIMILSNPALNMPLLSTPPSQAFSNPNQLPHCIRVHFFALRMRPHMSTLCIPRFEIPSQTPKK